MYEAISTIFIVLSLFNIEYLRHVWYWFYNFTFYSNIAYTTDEIKNCILFMKR